MPYPQRRGFTLIELLVVIAIILILAAILFPVFAKVRAKALQTACVNNMNQLGKAAEMYQSAWGDVLVPYGMPWGGDHIWYSLLDPYLKQIEGGHFSDHKLGKIYRCPAALEEETQGWAVQRSYGMSAHCGGCMNVRDAIVIPVARAKYPSQTIRIAEVAWEPTPGAGQGGSAFAHDPRVDDGREFPERHNGVGEVLWIDGHVSAMTHERYDLMDNQPNPAVWLRLGGPKPQP